MTEKSPVRRLKKLESQYYRAEGNKKMEEGILGRITTLKKTHNLK